MPRAAATTIVRHAGRGGKGGHPYLPPFDHPALTEARTIFGSTVRDPDEAGAILKSGHNNPKLGRRVEKGRWAGFPIFHLTLEERATCPATCLMWRACMGNNMPLAHRWRAGPELEEQLAVEIDRRIRDMHKHGKIRGELFIHRSGKPLAEVDLSTAEERGQGMLMVCEAGCGL